VKDRRPFYISRGRGAKTADISKDSIGWFVKRAKNERDYTFSDMDSVDDILKQLVLKDGTHLLNAALMLFGIDPQRYCPSAVVKCSHYFGTEVARPIPSHQVFGGTLFQQVDRAVDFVLSRINRSVGGRQEGPVAQVRMEIPSEAITEIIVNAVVHRDYDSAGSVQIALFADRVEVINPGSLPEQLTIDDLAKRHLSIPVNPFLARPFFLAGYINQLGYGTQNVVKWCRRAQLPDPVFEQLNQQFSVTIWRNWLTNQRLEEFDLNDRQRAAIRHLKSHRSITNSKYQDLFGVAKRTASQDLKHLTSLGLIEKEGTTGKGVFYRIAKGAPKGHKGHKS
jgi:predicted HTH transcriptional regulator